MHDIENRTYSQEAEGFPFASGRGVFNHNREMELARELLELGNEQELEQFLGDLIKQAGSDIGSAVSHPSGRRWKAF
jgi:hypothetical protein